MNRAYLAVVLCLASPLGAQTPAPGNDIIRKDALKADLFFLASDEMQGRLTEDPENRIAALFIRSRFERLGLKPMGPEESFFQPYVLSKPSLGETNEIDVCHAATTSGSASRMNVGSRSEPPVCAWLVMAAPGI